MVTGRVGIETGAYRRVRVWRLAWPMTRDEIHLEHVLPLFAS